MGRKQQLAALTMRVSPILTIASTRQLSRVACASLGSNTFANPIGEALGQRNLAVTANTYTHVLSDGREVGYGELLSLVSAS